jgi:hypothetical protein
MIKSPSERYDLVKISVLSSKLNPSKIQRVLIPERVEKIYQEYHSDFKKGKEIQLPGCLILAEKDDTVSLLDGQHRFTALYRLYTEEKHDQTVPINTIVVCSDEEIRKLFNKVNDACPVAEIPEGISRETVNIAVKHFTDKYPKCFSSARSGTAQRPHIHISRFEVEMNKLSEIYPNPKELISILTKKNEQLRQSNLKVFQTKKNESLTKVESFRNKAAEKGGLMFGMFPEFECFADLYPSKVVRVRKSIAPVLRNRVWNIYYPGKSEGECMFCGNKITQKECHMAHNLAFVKGGDENVDNLYPCCGTCNLSMGTLSCEEFLASLKKV